MLIYDFSIVILNIVKNDTEFSNFNVSFPLSSYPYGSDSIR